MLGNRCRRTRCLKLPPGSMALNRLASTVDPKQTFPSRHLSGYTNLTPAHNIRGGNSTGPIFICDEV